MKEIHHVPSMTFPNMQRNQNIERVPVLRDLQGPRCVYCGSLRYFLVFRVSEDGRNGILVGQCSNCRTSRELTVGDIEWGTVPESESDRQEQRVEEGHRSAPTMHTDKHNFEAGKLPQCARIGKAVKFYRLSLCWRSSVKSECVAIHPLPSCVKAMGGRKDVQKDLTCRDGVQVLGTQANLVKEHSTDYLDVMQKDCASTLH